MKRRDAREAVLCMLFDYSFQSEEKPEDLLDMYIEHYYSEAEKNISAEIREDKYFSKVYFGVISNIEEIDSIIAANPNSIIILDYALLPWMKQFKKCDIKMLVSASFEDRFKRVQERENVTKEYFENRDKKIAGYNEFKFDLEVDNSKPLNINDILDFIKSKQEHNND